MAQFFTNALGTTAIIGTELIPMDKAAGGSKYNTIDQIVTYATPTIVAAAVTAALAAVASTYGYVLNLPNGQYSTDSTNADFTVAAAKVAGARLVTLDLTGVLAAGHNIQMPTAAALVAAVPNAVVGESYVLRIINNSSGAFAWTVTTNTGITLNGTVTVAQNTFREFLVTLTSLVAVVLQNIGSGNN